MPNPDGTETRDLLAYTGYRLERVARLDDVDEAPALLLGRARRRKTERQDDGEGDEEPSGLGVQGDHPIGSRADRSPGRHPVAVGTATPKGKKKGEGKPSPRINS